MTTDSHREFPEPDPPLAILPEAVVIPRKPKPASGVEHTDPTNGTALPVGQKRKRSLDEVEVETENIHKRGKVAEEDAKAILIEDDDGAIVLD